MDGSSRQTQSKRTKLLDDLDDQYRNAKRARFNHTVARLLDDLDSDADAMSLSSVSGENSEDNSDSEPDSDASASFSDLEDNYFATREQMILDLMAEIETTRVFDPMPRIPKASQLHLLDEWRELNHPNFRKKLRVDPEIFDGLHELINDHNIFPQQFPERPIPSTDTARHLSVSCRPLWEWGVTRGNCRMGWSCCRYSG
jgi:hypothetical protein